MDRHHHIKEHCTLIKNRVGVKEGLGWQPSHTFVESDGDGNLGWCFKSHMVCICYLICLIISNLFLGTMTPILCRWIYSYNRMLTIHMWRFVPVSFSVHFCLSFRWVFIPSRPRSCPLIPLSACFLNGDENQSVHHVLSTHQDRRPGHRRWNHFTSLTVNSCLYCESCKSSSQGTSSLSDPILNGNHYWKVSERGNKKGRPLSIHDTSDSSLIQTFPAFLPTMSFLRICSSFPLLLFFFTYFSFLDLPSLMREEQDISFPYHFHPPLTPGTKPAHSA